MSIVHIAVLMKGDGFAPFLDVTRTSLDVSSVDLKKASSHKIPLLSLLSDCGPDTPDSSIKEEPSEEASEVRISHEHIVTLRKLMTQNQNQS